MLRVLGAQSLSAVRYTGGLGVLLVETLWWMTIGPLSGKGRLRYDDTLRHMQKLSLRSTGILSLVIFFVGMIVALQMAYVLNRLGVTEYVANITGVAMTREMGPLLVGMVMTGYAGAAIAAEIGTMVVSEEVIALEVSSLNPIRFLIVPRILAAMAMMPFVSLLATYVGILGGFVVGCGVLGMDAENYMFRTFTAVSMADVTAGLLKAEAFGVLIALIACQEGLSVKGGATGVGSATTRAVVRGMVGIILCDLVFTAVFYAFL